MLDQAQRVPTKLGSPLRGEIDVAVADKLEPVLLAVAVSTRGSRVVFDCAELTFIDVSGIRMLLNVAQRSGKPVQLANLDPGCRFVFKTLGLCELFGIDEIPDLPLRR